MSNFWDMVWLIFSTFLFVAYLIILFHIVVDLLTATATSGAARRCCG